MDDTAWVEWTGQLGALDEESVGAAVWATREFSDHAHPEDKFVVGLMARLARHPQASAPLLEVAMQLAQAMLDEVGLDGDVVRLDVPALMARSTTLSMQRRLSTRQRALLAREFRLFLRNQGRLPTGRQRAQARDGLACSSLAALAADAA
jgi:hypothetical protein